MGTGAGLIGFYIVGAQNLAMHAQPHRFWLAAPSKLAGLPASIDIRTVGIGITRRCYLLKNGPDSIEVGVSCLADNH